MTTTTPNLFKHRFDIAQMQDPIDVQDTLNAMADQAQGVLMLLSSHFEGENRVDDEIILNCIDTVFQDINDMKAAVKAHFEAVDLLQDATN